MQAASPTTVLTEDTTDDMCPACGHLLSGHDTIGRRWCAATALGVGSRACMCTEQTFAAAPAKRHY